MIVNICYQYGVYVEKNFKIIDIEASKMHLQMFGELKALCIFVLLRDF